MNKVIASNVLNEYPIASSIINELVDNPIAYNLTDQSTLYFGFPKFVGYEEGTEEPDLVILSPRHGVLILRFTLENNLTVDSVEEISDELFGLIFSKLNESKILRKKRKELQLPVETYVFSENDNNIKSEYLCNSFEDIKEKLNQQICESIIDEKIINEAKSIIEGTKALSTKNSRKVDDNDTSSKLYIINQLENEIKNFDFDQLQSAITIIDGPQRIRGLAGSGKTVVLAMKAAQIHINEPDKNILVTFYTKSLYEPIP